MRHAASALQEVRNRLARGAKLFLFLDFDGTLSPIAITPERAQLPNTTRLLMKKLSRRCFITIVSGRPLAEIREKIGVPGIRYAGNHGFEWDLYGARHHIALDRTARATLRAAARALREISRSYPGAFLERKRYTLSLHYRRLPLARQRSLRRGAAQVLRPWTEKNILRVSRGKKVYEVRPSIVWNKGDFVRMVLREDAARLRLALYIGDDATDEDAFRALPRDITIRIGKSSRSVARFYLPSQRSIDSFLAALLLAADIDDRKLKR